MTPLLTCPCCGYRTLSSGPGDYEVCPVCGWEDDGAPPWSVLGPNGSSLVEAQLAYLAEGRLARLRAQRPYRSRRGWRRRRRPPRRGEDRDPGWRPLDHPEELLERARPALAEEVERERRLASSPQALAARAAEDRALAAFNAELADLGVEAPALPLALVEVRLARLQRRHGWSGGLPTPYQELFARDLHDPGWRRRPGPVLGWLWHHRHHDSLLRRLRVVVTGRVRLAR